MASWKQRFVTGLIAGPIVAYCSLHKITIIIIAHCKLKFAHKIVFCFLLHKEFSALIAAILKFNSSE